jgi:hypothetical protein
MYEVHSATGLISSHNDLMSAYHAWQGQPNPDECTIVFAFGADHE